MPRTQRLRPAFGERHGQVTGAAAEVDDVSGASAWIAGGEVEERAATLTRVAAVLERDPSASSTT